MAGSRESRPLEHPVGSPNGLERWPALASAAGLVALVVSLVYLPAVLAGLGFVSDDFMILERVRQAGGLRGAGAFFGQFYYDYYRPLGFVSFAADWSLWRDWAPGYHVVSLSLHVINTLLVLLVARRLVGPQAAMVAATVFGLHVVNQEAVFWASARFDLLATAGALGSIYALGSPGRWRLAAVALLYLAALLSKESVVALPVAAGAYAWLIRRERAAGLVRMFVWLGAAGILYVLLRQASGLAAAGGASRLPKLILLAVLPLVQLGATLPASVSIRRWLEERRDLLFACAAFIFVGIGAVALGSAQASALRGPLHSFGFAALHLASPMSPGRWLSPLPGWLGLVGWAAAAALLLVAWRLADRPVPAFLAFFLVAAIVPVSSMTEGPRYLYLASVPVAIFVAWGVSVMRPRQTAPAYTLLAVLLIAFGWQVRAKGRDWLWASDMTTRTVATIVEAAGPGCRGTHILLATAPVRVRGVYANINAEALAALGDCKPASVRTLVRLGYDAPAVTAELTPGGLTMRIEPYSGGFVTSADLQRFSIQLGPGVQTVVYNPLGRFEAAPAGNTFVIRQAFAHPMDPQARWFVLSRGQLEFLPASSQATPAGQDRR